MLVNDDGPPLDCGMTWSKVSSLEGNFPPQVFEAVSYRVPIVATRLPLIVERLKEDSDKLILCEPSSMEEFLGGIKLCLDEPNLVLDRQEPIREILLKQGSLENFNENVLKMFNQIDC